MKRGGVRPHIHDHSTQEGQLRLQTSAWTRPPGAFLRTRIHDRGGFHTGNTGRLAMHTFTTACHCAEGQQAVHIKKEGKNKQKPKHSYENESRVFSSGRARGSVPCPGTRLRAGVASALPPAPGRPQHRGACLRGLAYHVSGTSKSLAELSAMPPGRKRTKRDEQGEGTRRLTQDRAAARPRWGNVPRQVASGESGARQTEATLQTHRRQGTRCPLFVLGT